MVDRVLVKLSGGAPVFRVSKPGIDVNSASYDNLVFDGGTGGYSGIFMSGVIAQASFTSVGSQATQYGTLSNLYRADIMFGKTFSRVPKAVISTIDVLLGANWRTPRYRVENGANVVDVWVEPQLDRLRCYMRQAGTGYTRPANFSYVVFHA